MIALPNQVVEEIDNDEIVQAVVDCAYPYWHVSELMEIVMNAKSMSRVLTFMRGAWAVSTEMSQVTSFDGLCIDVESGRVAQGGRDVYVLRDIVSAFQMTSSPSRTSIGSAASHHQPKVVATDGCVGVSASTGRRHTQTEMQWLERLGLGGMTSSAQLLLLESVCASAQFSTSVFASAIQKLIRFRTKQCVIRLNDGGGSGSGGSLKNDGEAAPGAKKNSAVQILSPPPTPS